jgi:hypothetical protein
MAVVPLTLTISLCLVVTFLVFFLCEHARGRLSSAERDSLLPLGDETPHFAAAKSAAEPKAKAHGSGCGCHDGFRPPCPGCLKHHD